MHADISRLTAWPDRHYSAVIAQQGRVQLDSDLNEQLVIQVSAFRALAADLIGPDGGPRESAGFAITHVPGKGEPDDLTIGPGRYYVDGIGCDAGRTVQGPAVPETGEPQAPEQPGPWTYWTQPDGFLDPAVPADRLPTEFPYLVYLQVWERSVTAAEDPDLREVALGPSVADTAARLKLMWQVRAVPGGELDAGDDPDAATLRTAFAKWAARTAQPGLAARARRPEDADDDPGLARPDARYRGPENQLYRVEIHTPGTSDTATLKWSRENGSVTVPVDAVDGTWLDLADEKPELAIGDWVELLDAAYATRLEPLPLLRIEEVDLAAHRVRLSAEPGPRVGRDPGLHPYLRRWDHVGILDGAVPLTPGKWMPLEDGVEIYLPSGDFRYATGDYWLIPARTATGDVEWPTDDAGRPLLKGRNGFGVSHAPLAWITGPGQQTDLRLTFPPLTTATTPAADRDAPATGGDAPAADTDKPAADTDKPAADTDAQAEPDAPDTEPAENPEPPGDGPPSLKAEP